LIEASCGAAVPVVIASHDDDSLKATRKIPKAGQRLLRKVHLQNQVGQQALLFIRLRNRDKGAQVNPIRLWIAGGRSIEFVIGADRR